MTGISSADDTSSPHKIMAAKKTAKKTTNTATKTATKPAATTATKKVAKNAATKEAPAKKATKKATTKVVAKGKTPAPSLDEITRVAYSIYLKRIDDGTPGDSQSDWTEAERQLSLCN